MYKDMLLRGGVPVCGDGGVFTIISVKLAKSCLCSAENPSVSLRDPPSLRREGAIYTHRPLRLAYQDTLSRQGSFKLLPGQAHPYTYLCIFKFTS